MLQLGIKCLTCDGWQPWNSPYSRCHCGRVQVLNGTPYVSLGRFNKDGRIRKETLVDS